MKVIKPCTVNHEAYKKAAQEKSQVSVPSHMCNQRDLPCGQKSR